MTNDVNQEDNLTSVTPKTPVTVETAVFVDETLYEIMKKTFPGSYNRSCHYENVTFCCDDI